jgi:diaminopimelate decarboxylase
MKTPTPESDSIIDGDMGHFARVIKIENLCRELERERDLLREWAAREIQQMPDMGGGVPYSWEKLDEQSRSMWRMRADEAASRLAAQGLERKTK